MSWQRRLRICVGSLDLDACLCNAIARPLSWVARKRASDQSRWHDQAVPFWKFAFCSLALLIFLPENRQC